VSTKPRGAAVPLYLFPNGSPTTGPDVYVDTAGELWLLLYGAGYLPWFGPLPFLYDEEAELCRIEAQRLAGLS
jgi:hypothetical protein